MLSIAHAATGATIASSVTNPYLAIPLILASHYALDAVYHHDAGTGLSSGRKSRQTALILGIIDLVLAALIVLLFYPPTSLAFANLLLYLTTPFFWGALLGLLPDFLESPRNFLGHEPKWLKPINHFHASFHHSTPNVVAGLIPQIILLTLLWMVH
jgi:hypothetical protein